MLAEAYFIRKIQRLFWDVYLDVICGLRYNTTGITCERRNRWTYNAHFLFSLFAVVRTYSTCFVFQVKTCMMKTEMLNVEIFATFQIHTLYKSFFWTLYSQRLVKGEVLCVRFQTNLVSLLFWKLCSVTLIWWYLLFPYTYTIKYFYSQNVKKVAQFMVCWRSYGYLSAFSHVNSPSIFQHQSLHIT